MNEWDSVANGDVLDVTRRLMIILMTFMNWFQKVAIPVNHTLQLSEPALRYAKHAVKALKKAVKPSEPSLHVRLCNARRGCRLVEK